MAGSSKYSLKERLNVEELYNVFLGLDSRQQIIALVGTGIFLLLLIFIPISCASSKISKKEKNVLNHQKNMEDLQTKLREYQDLIGRQKAIEGSWSGKGKVAISTTLESLSAQSGIDKNIDSIKENPATASSDILDEQSASVRVSRVSLQQALDYLYKIETFPQAGFKVKKLQIKPRYDNRQLFDVSFDVSTYSLKEGASS